MKNGTDDDLYYDFQWVVENRCRWSINDFLVDVVDSA